MNDISLIKKIFILLCMFLFLPLAASAGLWPGYVQCELGTDCILSYKDFIVIPVEKTDYMCHIKQIMNPKTDGFVSTVFIDSTGIERVEMGKGNYEANAYVPSRKIPEEREIHFSLETNFYKSSIPKVIGPTPKPIIVVRCRKL